MVIFFWCIHETNISFKIIELDRSISIEICKRNAATIAKSTVLDAPIVFWDLFTGDMSDKALPRLRPSQDQPLPT